MFSGSHIKQLNKDGTEITVLALNGYAPSDMDMNPGATSYYGFIDADGNWYISKHVTANAITNITYAVGTSGYTTAWTARAAQSYDTFDAKF